MATSDQKVQITKLNGNNYQTWKLNTKWLLMERGLWGFVTGSEVRPEIVEEKKNADGVVTNADEKRQSQDLLNKYNLRSDKAFSTIALNIESDLQIHIASKNTPKEAWDTLQNHCEFVSVTQMVRLTRRFYAAKMEEGDDMMKHITEMTTLAQQLREMNEDITSRKFATVMLGSLPSSYDNLVTSMSARDINQLDWESVKGVLVEEFMKRKEKEKTKASEDALLTRRMEDALYTSSGNDNQYHNNPSRGGRGRSNSRGRRGASRSSSRESGRNFNQHPYNRPQNTAFRGPCFLCHQIGHVARACPQNQSRESEEGNIAEVGGEGSNPFHETDFALMVTNGETNTNKETPVTSTVEAAHFHVEAPIETQFSEVEVDEVEETEIVVESDFALINSEDVEEVTDELVDHDWYIDSAATKHMSNQWSTLTNFKRYNSPTPIVLGDKSNILALGEGQMRLPTADGTCLALQQVLYVPKLSKNLLSVPYSVR